MTLISRHIKYDERLGKYTLETAFDGENETLIFDTKAMAQSRQRYLLDLGAEYFLQSMDKN